jgi:flagellar basal body rod protein FlgG
VQAPEGGELYTRNGSLDISQTRELVSSQGLPLLDRFNKKIRLAGQDYAITSRGEIFVDGNYLTSLKIVKLNKEMELEKAGNNLIKATGAKPETVGSPTLAQGMLEASNSDLMAEMTNMIVIQRSYEFQSRVLDTIVGQLLRRTVSDIPKPL